MGLGVQHCKHDVCSLMITRRVILRLQQLFIGHQKQNFPELSVIDVMSSGMTQIALVAGKM